MHFSLLDDDKRLLWASKECKMTGNTWDAPYPISHELTVRGAS